MDLGFIHRGIVVRYHLHAKTSCQANNVIYSLTMLCLKGEKRDEFFLRAEVVSHLFKYWSHLFVVMTFINVVIALTIGQSKT